MKKKIILFALLWLTLNSALAENIHFLSIEWLVDSSDIIAMGEILEKGKGQYDDRKPPSISISQTLKTIKGLQIPSPSFSLVWPSNCQWQCGDAVVLFCRKKGAKFFAFYQFTLNDFSRGIDLAVCKTGEIIKNREVLLRKIKRRISENRQLPPDCIRENGDRNTGFPFGFVRIFPETLSSQDNYSGLIVPADPEFKTYFINQLKFDSSQTKATAIASLSNYYDKNLVPILIDFLNDFHFEPFPKGNGYIKLFPVVQASYRVLKMWKVEIEKPKVIIEDNWRINY